MGLSIYDWQSWILAAILLLIIIWIIIVISRKTSPESTSETSSKESSRVSSVTTKESSSSKQNSLHNSIVVSRRPTNERNLSISMKNYEAPKWLENVSGKVSNPSVTRDDLSVSSKEAEVLDIIEYNPENRKMQSKIEKECDKALYDIFGFYFDPHVRSMEILRNPITNRKLELDFYTNKTPIPIAVEVHGKQHYEVVKRFHPSGEKDLKYQQWKDQFKLKQCDDNGIFLISVPYNAEGRIRAFIEHYLRQADLMPNTPQRYISQEKISHKNRLEYPLIY